MQQLIIALANTTEALNIAFNQKQAAEFEADTLAKQLADEVKRSDEAHHTRGKLKDELIKWIAASNSFDEQKMKPVLFLNPDQVQHLHRMVNEFLIPHP